MTQYTGCVVHIASYNLGRVANSGPHTLTILLIGLSNPCKIIFLGFFMFKDNMGPLRIIQGVRLLIRVLGVT